MEIEIKGFNQQQRDLADLIWSCESLEDVKEFFGSLPPSLLHDAYVVYLMIVWAYADAEELGEMYEANEVIDHIRSL